MRIIVEKFEVVLCWDVLVFSSHISKLDSVCYDRSSLMDKKAVSGIGLGGGDEGEVGTLAGRQGTIDVC